MKSNEKHTLIAGALLGVAVLLLGVGLAVTTRNDESSSAKRLGAAPTGLKTLTTTFDPTTQYLGPCGVVTPPIADPCQAAQGMSRYVFWDAMVNASIFQSWKKSNPGEWIRLQAHMNAPLCGSGTGLPQDMITMFGAALFADVQAYACALGTEPITLPAANPPPKAGAKDKTPPTPPGPVIVTP